MAPTNPRIIVVDSSLSLHQVVRAAMELMGRRPRMIETATGEDALAELRISAADLLITAHTLLGTVAGPDLAIAAKRELAGMPVILVANESDPELDEEILGQGLFQYLRRPFAAEAFLRAVRVAIDGPEAAPKEAPAEEIVPVPPIDESKISDVMYRLMRDVGAMAIVLADRHGKVLSYSGAAGYVDRDALAAALAPGFSNTLKILPLIGDQPRVLKYYDGERGNLFGLALGLHHYLLLIFDGGAPPAALGNVKRYGFNAVNEMLGIIGSVAFEARPSLPPPKPAESHVTSPKRRTHTQTQEMAAVKADADRAKRADKGEKADKPERGKADGARKTSTRTTTAPAVQSFDPALLEGLENIDLSQADELFDPDRMATVASQNGDRISYDDALMQGIIGNIEE